MSSGEALGRALIEELERWSSAGQIAAFWWRDDDAVRESAALDRLLGLGTDLDLTPAIAVIPEGVHSSLVRRLTGTRIPIWQHGFNHDFHVAGEFGDGRSLDDLRLDAIRGQICLDDAFGPAGWQHIFVPPNHMLSAAFKGLLPDLGYCGVSAGVPHTPVIAHVAEVNADVDVMDWPAGRLLGIDRIGLMIAGELAQRRTQERFGDPLGLLTHHLAFDREAWDDISAVLRCLRGHSSVTFLAPEDLFPSSPMPASMGQPAVSVVITSCGRPDLLEITLDSFFRHCDYPVREIIIMEDGDRPSSLAASNRFDGRPLRWLCTGARCGQVRAVDRAYALVRSPYIFHCEDDWEFHTSGFLEKSLAILEQDTRILQVWLRALDDTNRHPVEDDVRYAHDVPYRRMARFESGEWGTWHGFSWNPGLRRRRDYLLLGSFGRFLEAGFNGAWEVERGASAYYADHGMSAAILADNDGRGYVRHVGWGRRVGDPVLSPAG